MGFQPSNSNRSLAISEYPACNVTSLGNEMRPSAEEWYPRLHLGWNHKECVDMYCYFALRPFNADIEVKWAIHPTGPPFRGKSQPMSFDHILQLADMQSTSDSVQKAIAMGLSTQYYSQKMFRLGTPAYQQAEPTPEEVLTAWEAHSLDISDAGNIEMVKNAVMSTFGICITKGEVELLTQLGSLSKISVFETNTWRRMLCFRCCPKRDNSSGLASPVSSNDNFRKRKNDDMQENDQPAPKRLALPVPQVTPSRERTWIATDPRPISATSECIIVALPKVASPSTSDTHALQAASSPESSDKAQRNQSLAHKISISEALSNTLTISSWLRLLLTLDVYSVKAYSRESSTIIQKWLKDTFDIDLRWSAVYSLTESAKLENVSPLQTAAFKCMVATARKDLWTTLMSLRPSAGIDQARRISLGGLSGNIEEAMRKALRAGPKESDVMFNSQLTRISNRA
ncbi:hypothetical protein VTL71DRAFT_3145 [Oculimacula yallundae]|uniref:Uncharacterized protein n=1 Tax=Oculimacula yallundae TaxID=86028 RepID=A0ABR4C6A1_9HELO